MREGVVMLIDVAYLAGAALLWNFMAFRMLSGHHLTGPWPEFPTGLTRYYLPSPLDPGGGGQVLGGYLMLYGEGFVALILLGSRFRRFMTGTTFWTYSGGDAFLGGILFLLGLLLAGSWHLPLKGYPWSGTRNRLANWRPGWRRAALVLGYLSLLGGTWGLAAAVYGALQ